MRWRRLSGAARGLLSLVSVASLGCEYASQGAVLTSLGPPGASGSAGNAATGSSCDPARDLVCLDFEDAATPLPSLVLIGATGTAQYDPSASAVGQQSLRISVATDANYVLEVALPTPITSGSVYLRGMFRLPNVEPGSYVVLMEAMNQDASRKISFDWRPQVFGLNSDGATSYGVGSLPQDRWFCAELAIDVASAAGAARLAIDRAPTVELLDRDTVLGSGLGLYRIGVNGGPGNPALDINVDDFVVRAEPIGCP